MSINSAGSGRVDDLLLSRTSCSDTDVKGTYSETASNILFERLVMENVCVRGRD